MSIPLDRLYNVLQGLNNQHGDTIIYCWQPHGSKKLEDLRPYGPRADTTWLYRACTPFVIYHDQEPLNFDLYNQQVLKDYVLNKFPGQIPDPNPVLDHYIDMHLRCALNEPHHGHDLVMLCHSERNSKELDRYESKNFQGVYYWSHALIARDWFRCAEHDLNLYMKHISKDFLIYNRALSGTREYRLKFIELLIEHRVVEHCLTSFAPWDQQQHYQDHVYKNNDLKIHNQSFEDLLPLNTSNSNASADYQAADYCQTGIETVLETLFDDQRHHLTEKTLRPIACGQPFILAATPGSLKYLRSYGFKTFAPMINESYDEISDPLLRLLAIVQEMQRISKLSRCERMSLYAGLGAIAQHNKKLFFSNEWHRSVLDEYSNNFVKALTTVKQHRTGQLYREYGSVVHHAPERAKIFHQPLPGKRSQQELDQFVDWLDNTSS